MQVCAWYDLSVAVAAVIVALQLMTTEGNGWLYKNKDHGMMSAAASLGTILLWNVEEGLTQVSGWLTDGATHRPRNKPIDRPLVNSFFYGTIDSDRVVSFVHNDRISSHFLPPAALKSRRFYHFRPLVTPPLC